MTSVAFTEAQTLSPGRRPSAAREAAVISATSGTAPSKTDPYAVGQAVDVDDRHPPHVARAAVGQVPVQGDAMGLDDGEGVAGDRSAATSGRRRSR